MSKNLNLRAQLLLAFGSLLVLTAGLGLWSIIQLRALNHNAEELSMNWLPSVETVSAVNVKLGQYRIANLRLAATPAESEREALIQQAQDRHKELDSAIADYLPNVSSDEEARLARQLQECANVYTRDSGQLVDMVRAGRVEQARDYVLNGAIRQHGQDLSQVAVALVKLNHEGGDTEARAAHATYERAWISICLATAVAMVIGLVLALRISGDLRQRVGQAARAAEKFAAGDLTYVIEPRGGDEIALMLQALAAMRSQLAGLVQGVRINAESVATASAEISQGNADLSSRTEQQASALQQTAASMEQINGAARNNADNAAQASQLASQASGVADEGSRVVDSVVQTMRDIERASRQVEDIIGVIDGIAFQTNILALNAAVEAARAGKQGRGFAVVAGEVRALAQRSAEAARQVKQLIATSVERVASGTELVDRAGSTMSQVKVAVQRVNDIVGEIATGSREQMSGVGQVSVAVTQMDQSTQQNAALVEESAAAAESLRTQAEALVHVVSAFRTERPQQAETATVRIERPAKVDATPATRTKRIRFSTPTSPQVANDTEWATF